MRLSYKRDKKLNWLLMCVVGNYCDGDDVVASPGGVFFLGLLHRLLQFTLLNVQDRHLSY